MEGKRDRLGKRGIGVDGGRRQLNQVSLGVEWSGLVVGGSQISDVKQERERDQSWVVMI